MSNWVNESVFYHIYPLGFCGAPSKNDWGETVPRIKKVIEWIPHLKKIGVNAIYFGPLFESTEHGYDTADYNKLDRRLGTNEDFKEVCKELHKNGISVVVDGVFNHVGRDFWAFKDVQQNKQSSKYCGWFENLNFGGPSPMGDPFWYEGWEGHYNLVKLNLKNQEVVDYLLNSVGNWMEEYKIDGLRLDVAYCMDEEFFRKLNAYCKAKREDFWLMGEMVHGDYARLAKPGMLDSVTNYECYKGIYSSHNDKNYFEIAHSLNRQFGRGGIYEKIYTYNFIDNHDVNRIGSVLSNENYIYNVYTILYTMPGVPSIYYGSEWAIKGMKSNGSDAPIRPCLELNDMDDNCKLIKHLERLAYARKNSYPLKYGSYEQVLVRNQQFVFCRVSGDDRAYIAVNLSDNDEYLNFNVNKNEEFKDLLTGESIGVNNYNVNIKVPAFSGKILVVASSLKEEFEEQKEVKVEEVIEYKKEETLENKEEVLKEEKYEEKTLQEETKDKKVVSNLEEEKTISEEETKEARIKILNDKLDALQTLINDLRKEVEDLKNS